MRQIITAMGLFLIAQVAWAESKHDIVGKCFVALASGNENEYRQVVDEISTWGEIPDQNLRAIIENCIEMGQRAGYWEGSSGGSLQAEMVSDSTVATFFQSLLAEIEAESKSVPDVIETILFERPNAKEGDNAIEGIESAILEFVKPIPASQVERNLTAYQALALLRPESEAYASKVQHYSNALERQEAKREARKSSIVRTLRKHTAEFDGSSWYRHPNSPRYQDTRPYLTLYVLESGSGHRELEFFINYTGDGWLFVRSAKLNIDGEFVTLPPSAWSRDNDSDIWEWTGFDATPNLIEIARKVAESGRTVIRFEGQEFYDDYVLPRSDKNVIRDMLDAWEVMKSQ